MILSISLAVNATLRVALTAKEIVKITEGVAARRFDSSRHGLANPLAVRYVTLVVGRSLVGAFGASLTRSAPGALPNLEQVSKDINPRDGVGMRQTYMRQLLQ